MAVAATILVDSPAVWASFQADLAAARDCVYVQTYSFEGDRAGTALSDALLAAAAPDRRLLVDSYTRANHSDRWLIFPPGRFDRELRAEVRNTRRLVRTLRAEGVGVRFGRPFGFLAHRFLHRDHKKLFVFDDRVAYVGGVNFSEHNFEWHDLMVRIEHPEVTSFLKRDFLRSWEGRSEAESCFFPDLDLHLLAGKGNRDAYRRIFALIEAAKRSIWVISPYVSPPFTSHLAAAAAHGVKVGIVTPSNNNKAYMQKYLLAEASRSGFDMWMFEDRMVHMKCMLIDDTLVAGSSNFDLMSYNGFLAEIVGIFRSPKLVRAFRRLVLEPDLASSSRYDDEGADERGGSRLAGMLRTVPIRAGCVVARALKPR